MSKLLNITVSRKDVQSEVAKITGYIGKKVAADGTAYETIATIAENDEILNTYFDESCSTLENALNRLASTIMMVDEDCVNMALTMTDNWDDKLAWTINEKSKNYLVNHVVGQWMHVVGRADEDKYNADALTALAEIKLAVNRRRRPVHKSGLY